MPWRVGYQGTALDVVVRRRTYDDDPDTEKVYQILKTAIVGTAHYAVDLLPLRA